MNSTSASGVALLRNQLRTGAEPVLGNFGIYMAYAMVSSGHLPLMMPVLLLSFLAEGLVTTHALLKLRGSSLTPSAIQKPHVNFLF